MKTYLVEITETLQKTVEVQAHSKAEAEAIAEDQWRHEKYVLTAEDFVTVEFKAIGERKAKDFEK